MYKISIYGCAMFKKLVYQWVKGPYLILLQNVGFDILAVVMLTIHVF